MYIAYKELCSELGVVGRSYNFPALGRRIMRSSLISSWVTSQDPVSEKKKELSPVWGVGL
jgi:hypothetical protein